MSEQDDFIEKISPIVEQIKALQFRALAEYTQVVENLLTTNNRDAQHIERTLDGLLDFCGNDGVLLLFRRLCRHYYDFAPAAAVYYVYAYREMWNSEGEGFSEANE